MYQDLLTKSGLNNNEAIIYEYLLTNGKSVAMDITKNTPLKKGVIYVTLNDLIKKGIISQKMLKPQNPNVRNVKQIAYFSPEHPEKLNELLKNKQKELNLAQSNLDANLGELISSFSLVSGKPGIRYFEGVKGIKTVLDDTLTSKETICAYSDIEAIHKYIPKMNQEYVRQREALNIKKRGIIIDSPFARNYLKNYYSSVTENKFINAELFPFNSLMQIYDNKVAYITLSKTNMIGVVIEDKNIYQMHKSLYEDTWRHAKPL